MPAPPRADTGGTAVPCRHHRDRNAHRSSSEEPAVSPKALRLTLTTVLAAGVVGVPAATAVPSVSSVAPAPGSATASGASAASASSAPPAPPTPPATAARTAESVLAAMTLRQRIGQLFMVGTPA